jgi:hypothetical protein
LSFISVAILAGFFYLQHKIAVNDLALANAVIDQKNEKIADQQQIITVQNAVLDITKKSFEIQRTSIASYTAAVVKKTKDLDETLKMIQDEKFAKSECKPADSLKAVISSIQAQLGEK